MLNDELRKFVEDQSKFIIEYFKDGDKDYYSPMLGILVGKDGDRQNLMFLVDVPFNEHEEKHKFMASIADFLFENDFEPVAACLSAEAWQAMIGKDDKDGLKKRPSEHENRVEVIMVSGMSVDNDRFATTAKVIRGDKDIISLDEFSEIIEGGRPNLIKALFDSYHRVRFKK